MPFVGFRLIIAANYGSFLILLMKDTGFVLLLLGLTLSGCGQPGPLYLPTAKPPIYVEPEPEAESKKEPKKETKPAPPQPLPQKPQPTTKQ